MKKLYAISADMSSGYFDRLAEKGTRLNWKRWNMGNLKKNEISIISE